MALWAVGGSYVNVWLLPHSWPCLSNAKMPSVSWGPAQGQLHRPGRERRPEIPPVLHTGPLPSKALPTCASLELCAHARGGTGRIRMLLRHQPPLGVASFQFSKKTIQYTHRVSFNFKFWHMSFLIFSVHCTGRPCHKV